MRISNRTRKLHPEDAIDPNSKDDCLHPTLGLEVPPEIEKEHPDWDIEVAWHCFSQAITRRLTSPGGETRFLKMVKAGRYPSIIDEAARMRWAKPFLPVPEILAEGATGRAQWLLTEGLPGLDGTHPALQADAPRLVKLLAHALRRFHQAPVKGCLFDFRLDAALQHACARLETGLIDPEEHFHNEFKHLTAEQALEHLVAARPRDEELVVCHGDYCVPNILFHEGSLSGFVDLGELGVADVWWDLAVATWSLDWNLGPGFQEFFLKEYGAVPDPARIQYYRLLYDVVS